MYHTQKRWRWPLAFGCLLIFGSVLLALKFSPAATAAYTPVANFTAAQTPTTTGGNWHWEMSGIHGGGMGQVIATDPNPGGGGHATLGGDSWGVYNTINAGNEWSPATKGMGVAGEPTGIQTGDGLSVVPGDFFFMGLAYSRKFPGRVYALTGKLEAPGTGNFGYALGNSYTVITREISGGESTASGGTRHDRPRPTGNRVIVDYDSSSGREYIYVGTGNGGGVARTTDAGNSWTTIGLSGLNSAITGMALDPDDPNTLYVGTRANGAYRITGIRGANRTSTPLTDAPTRVEEMATIGNSVYAACNTSGIYKLSNNGSIWTALRPGFFSSTSSTPPQWSAIGGTGNTIYVGCADPDPGHAIAKSVDGGQNWAWVTDNPNKINLRVWGRTEDWWLADANPNIILGSGSSYEAASIAVDQVDSQIVYSCGRSGAWVSKDGGDTWHPSVNHLGGTMHHNIDARVGGNVGVDDVDWHDIASNDYFFTAFQTAPASYGGRTLDLTKDRVRYQVISSVPRRFKRTDGNGNSVSIDDEYFRAACVRPSDIDVSDDGHYIYIAQFGGGVLVGTDLP